MSKPRYAGSKRTVEQQMLKVTQESVKDHNFYTKCLQLLDICNTYIAIPIGSFHCLTLVNP